MPRVKPEFGYTEPVDIAPELPENFKSLIEKIIRQDVEYNDLSVAKFIDELRVVLHRFQLAKRIRSSATGGKPTSAEMQRNAKEILKTTTDLIEMLQGEAGGLKHHINNGIGYNYSGRERYPSTEKLIKYLSGVKFGCKDFLGLTDDDHQELRLIPFKSNHPIELMSPIDYMAFSVASLMKDILNELPNDYIYEGEHKDRFEDGKYAQLLIACFEYTEKGVKHDIRTLMRKTLKAQ